MTDWIYRLKIFAICSRQGEYHKYRDANRLKGEKMEKIYFMEIVTKRELKEIGVSVLNSGQIDFKSKLLKEKKKSLYID